MKRLLFASVVLLLAFAGTSYGQWYVDHMDTALADSTFQINGTGLRDGFDPRAKLNYSDETTIVHEGAGSMKCDWTIWSSYGWGGYLGLQYLVPTDSTFKFIDFGYAKYISLWYYTETPSTAAPGTVVFRLQLHESGGEADYVASQTDHEDWYFQSSAVFDATPGWKQLLMPLTANGAAVNDQGFGLPGWSGVQNNGTLDLDKIVGWDIQWSCPLLGGDSTASGLVYFDQMQLLGTQYEPLYTFNDFQADTSNFNSVRGFWGPLGGMTFFEEPVDTFIAPTALGIDYKVNCSESWGGYCNFDYVFDKTTPGNILWPDQTAHTSLVFFVKVVEPLSSSTGTIANKVTMRFVLFEYGTGGRSDWFTVAPVKIDTAGLALGWQKVTVYLEGLPGSWGELSSKGFYAVNGDADGIFSLDKIGGFKFEFSASKDAGEPNAADLVYSGKVLVSLMTPAGYRETDVTPPGPVTGVAVTPSTYVNLITWNDVPAEDGAKYNVFLSEQAFTTTDDPGVEDLPEYNVATGTQLQTHQLRAPVTDQNITLYYGVTATDKAGNTNQPAVTGSTTNVAKGVPTISLSAPTFTADGDLSEWSAITPIVLSVNTSNPTAYLAPNTKIDGDADLLVRAYVAVDNTYLYVAFDIDDDLVVVDTLGTDYLQDCPDLFIGLYDWRGKKHGAYRGGENPDYHWRFSENRAFQDNNGIILKRPGEDYAWVKKILTPGYTIEFRISWADVVALNAADDTPRTDSLFVPQEGMRIPIDFSVNDNDGSSREGIMCYSPWNNDNSWAAMWRWTYTWIGSSWTVGVEQEQGIPLEYTLRQNYPNPFNPSTEIKYSLAKAGFTTVKVYDLLGREVATLVNQDQQPGNYTVSFNTASASKGLSSGAYFYRIESGSFRDIKKMMLLK
jgi:hypothetical protein